MKGNLAHWAFKGTIILFISCGFRAGADQADKPGAGLPVATEEDGDVNPYPFIDSIPVPAGYHRIPQPKLGFGEWLRQIALKKDRRVRLYDGRLKRNQDAQFAVLDVSVGNKDLQQCADAVMRLRAEWLFAQKRYREMEFQSAGKIGFNYGEWAAGQRYRQKGDRLEGFRTTAGDPASRAGFDNWLKLVFTYCGTLSLEGQLRPVDMAQMQVGDVLIKGGSPGHAMIVVDMAEDGAGHRLFMLAQSYMPAQDIHIVKNPADPRLGPWYRIDAGEERIGTPEWDFMSQQLRTWPGGVVFVLRKKTLFAQAGICNLAVSKSM